MRLFHHFISFINLSIWEKITDFSIIIFFFSIIFFFFFSFYLFYFSRLFCYNKICDKIYIKTCVKADKICDKYYCYNKEKFNNINKFNIKVFFSSFLSLLSRLSRLSRYNKICDKIYAKIYVKINKACDNAYDKYYYYNKKRFNNINKFNIKNIITFFLIKFLSLFISSKRNNSR